MVSTRVPAARRLSQVVRIADTAEEFTHAVEAALADPLELREARLAAVAGHSWDARVSEKSLIIRAALDARHAAAAD